MTDRESRTGPGEEPGDASQERPSESYDATRSELKKLAAIAVSLETLLDSMQNVVDGSDSESFIFRAAFERLTIREISKLVERCFRSESSSAHAAHGLLANVHTTLEDAYKEATAFEDRGQRERARHVMYLKGWKRVHGTACKDLNRSLAGLKTEIARKDPSRDGYLRDARRARDAKRRREFHRIENTAGRNSLPPNKRLVEVTLVSGRPFYTLESDDGSSMPETAEQEQLSRTSAESGLTPETGKQEQSPQTKTGDGTDADGSSANRYPSPPGTTWGKVTITMREDGTLNARATGGESMEYSALDLGLTDGRTGKPNLQWEFLLQLAKESAVSCRPDPNERNRFDKRVARLNAALQEFFGIRTEKPIVLNSDSMPGVRGPIRHKCWEPKVGLQFGKPLRTSSRSERM